MPPSGGARYRQALAGDQHFCDFAPGLLSLALALAFPEQLTPELVTVAVPPSLDLATPLWLRATSTLEVLPNFAVELAVLSKAAWALDTLLSVPVEKVFLFLAKFIRSVGPAQAGRLRELGHHLAGEGF